MESGSIHTRRGDSSRSSTYAYGRYSSYPAGGGSSQRRPVTNSASRSGRFPEQTRPDGGIDVQYSHSPSGLAASPYEYRNEEDDILNSKIGIYGWRKRCLYFFLVSVAVVLILNLALLVWITRIMRLNLVSTFTTSSLLQPTASLAYGTTHTTLVLFKLVIAVLQVYHLKQKY